MKRVGFLSFGHWNPSPGSQAWTERNPLTLPSPGSETRTAREAHMQTIELAEAAEEIGIDGAYLRVHHWARQLASPFPLLAAIGARTQRIEMGTAVIDMRYENPMYMAEDAAAADLISGGRLQLGISRGSAEPVLDGPAAFGYAPADGETGQDLGRRHSETFRAAIAGAGFAQPDPTITPDPTLTGSNGALMIQPQSPGLAERIWWGAGSRSTAEWAAVKGMNLMTSTLLGEETGAPFDELQAEQIELYRAAWAAAGWEREPRISVSRCVIPITTDEDRRYFGGNSGLSTTDQVGPIGGHIARFGKSYIGEPDAIAADLARDAAVMAADTLLLIVFNQLGVEYNAHLLESFAAHIGPAIGWTRAHDRAEEPASVT